MQKNLNRREFIKSAAIGVAAIAIPYQILGSDELFEIEVMSSNMSNYKITGTKKELRQHFWKKILPVMPDKLRELYYGTAIFALDLNDDPELLSKIFKKIKSKNFDITFLSTHQDYVIREEDYEEDRDNITFSNTIWGDYSLRGNFNNLEMKFYLKTDFPKFTKITGMEFYIHNLNLDENGKNNPDRVFKADSRGDIYKEYGYEGKHLKVFTHLQGGEVDVGGLRTLLTRALNKQELIKKDFEVLRQYIGKKFKNFKIKNGKNT